MRNILYILSFSLFSVLSCKTHKVNIDYPKGGYDFPVSVDTSFSNYYYYPIKDLESRRDSFWDGVMYKFYHAFNEPNLSLKPAEKPVFRFEYSGWRQKPVIILLTEGYIIVKEGKTEDVYIETSSKFSDIEKWQYGLVTHLYLPIDSDHFSPRRKRFIDSAINLYPQLLDTKYYRYLFEKATDTAYQFTYSTVIKAISNSEYEYLVNKINSSGYWNLPPVVKCKEAIADGGGFILEANTVKKYNVVKVQQVCPNDSSKFILACQELIKYARMDKQINLIWTSIRSTDEDIDKGKTTFEVKKYSGK